MKTTPTITNRDAAIKLWGEAGAYAHDAYARFRKLYFPDLPEQLPIVIGLTAYGHCVGLTRVGWEHGPRIGLHSTMLFWKGNRRVDDTLLHEMLHAHLMLAGLNYDHDGPDWYEALRELSPTVLGHELDIKRGADRKSVRIPNPEYEPGNGKPKTLVRKVPANLGWTHDMVSRWPSAFRPEGYDWGKPIMCPTY